MKCGVDVDVVCDRCRYFIADPGVVAVGFRLAGKFTIHAPRQAARNVTCRKCSNTQII